jgi:hypothetical protein
LLTALALSAALGLSACKGTSDEMGAVQVGLTDMPGEFLSYTVDVTSLVLTKADGSVVETLPQRTRVDLAQLADLAEFVTGATVPSGIYVGATLNLDYTSADLEVDDGAVWLYRCPANIRDAQGNPVTTMTVSVKLDNARPLTIVPFVPAFLDLDFNLAASNTVDMTTPASPVVTVSPLLVADVNPDAPKPHRIRGPLDSVNLQGGTFTLILRPFNLVLGEHGRFTFITDASTTFEINQVSSVGSAVTALFQQARLTAVVAVGTLVAGHASRDRSARGSSVVFGTSDVLTGNVIARNNNTLTRKARSWSATTARSIFRDTVSVTVGAGTKVIKQGSSAPCHRRHLGRPASRCSGPHQHDRRLDRHGRNRGPAVAAGHPVERHGQCRLGRRRRHDARADRRPSCRPVQFHRHGNPGQRRQPPRPTWWRRARSC